MKKLIVLFALFVGSLAVTSCAQTKEVQMDKFQSTYNALKGLVETKNYEFIGEVVYNNKKREVFEDDSNSFKINKSEVSGKITSLSTDAKVFNVNGTIKDYKVSFNDNKQQIAIQFRVISDNQNFDVYLDIKSNGKTFITYKFSAESMISQVGKLQSL